MKRSSLAIGACSVGGVILSISCAPIVAAGLGTLGLLGAASTGTAISSLSGAALVSASLASIGGSVTGGTVAISVLGGATSSAVVAVTNHLVEQKLQMSKEEIKETAKADRQKFKEFYEKYRDHMSAEIRAEWEKYV